MSVRSAAQLLGVGDGVECDRRRISPAVAPHDRHVRALGPDVELLDRGRAVRVGRAEHDDAARLLRLLGELADGRRLAGPVDADHQHRDR